MAYRQTPGVRRRLQQTRAQIVAAATGLVHDGGYAGCSMVKVAERAGVATGTLYRFFPGKGELFAEVFRTACAREVAAATAAASKDADSPSAAILAAVHTFCERALRAPKLAHALIAEPVDPLVDAERLVFRSTYTDLFAAAITEGIRLGQLPPQDPHISGAGIVGAINDVLITPLAQGAATPDVVPEIEAFVRRALGIPPRTATREK